MTTYDNKNTFALFKNDRKSEDRHPDYTGTFTDGEGREYFADAWVRKSGKGVSFMSGRMKPKNKQTGAPIAGISSDPLDVQLNDEVPF
jgi:uncharacterized protein (DUF736 family)